MIPIEKASELLVKYSQITSQPNKAAIICVDEIMLAVIHVESEYSYWKNVRTFLINI